MGMPVRIKDFKIKKIKKLKKKKFLNDIIYTDYLFSVFFKGVSLIFV